MAAKDDIRRDLGLILLRIVIGALPLKSTLCAKYIEYRCIVLGDRMSKQGFAHDAMALVFRGVSSEDFGNVEPCDNRRILYRLSCATYTGSSEAS